MALVCGSLRIHTFTLSLLYASDYRRFMYENGARNVLLTDHDVTRRRTPAWVKKELIIADDMNIMIEYANVHSYSDVERIVKLCSERNLPPLRGVFHLAAVLADGNLMIQDRELYPQQRRPKF